MSTISTYGKKIYEIGSHFIQLSHTVDSLSNVDIQCTRKRLLLYISEYEKDLRSLQLLNPPALIIDEHNCLIQGVNSILSVLHETLLNISYNKQNSDKKTLDIDISVINEHQLFLLNNTKQMVNKLIFLFVVK